MELKNENVYILRHSDSGPQTLQWVDAILLSLTDIGLLISLWDPIYEVS